MSLFLRQLTWFISLPVQLAVLIIRIALLGLLFITGVDTNDIEFNLGFTKFPQPVHDILAKLDAEYGDAFTQYVSMPAPVVNNRVLTPHHVVNIRGEDIPVNITAVNNLYKVASIELPHIYGQGVSQTAAKYAFVVAYLAALNAHDFTDNFTTNGLES